MWNKNPPPHERCPTSAKHWPRLRKRTVGLCATLWCLTVAALAQEYDLVIRNGRVLDPESGLDAIRNIGVQAGVIRAVSTDPLQGRVSIDASNLAVAPGF